MTEVRGRVAVVTGGASGIGRGIAEALLEEGASVIVADVERKVLESAAGEIGAVPCVADVMDDRSVQALGEFVVERFGAVDIFVNNAGVGPFGRISDLTLDDWKWVLDVNLHGVIRGVHTFLPLLSTNPRGGHIVNTASMAAFIPPVGLGAYNVSKWGIAALTETLADELEQDGAEVKVTLLAPGTVRTNIGTSQRNRLQGTGALVDVDVEVSEGAEMRWIEPIDAGRITVRAIRNNDRYALTHPEWWPQVEAAHHRLSKAFAQYPVLE